MHWAYDTNVTLPFMIVLIEAEDLGGRQEGDPEGGGYY